MEESKKYRTILLILAGIFASCTKNTDNETCEHFVCIAQGVHSNHNGNVSQNFIIRTQEEWENLKTTMLNKLSFREFKIDSESDIDFDKYQIIAVFDKERTNGGWIIKVTFITEHSDRIVVTVKAYYLGWLIAPKVMTQPYHIVKIPVTTKRIDFKYINN